MKNRLAVYAFAVLLWFAFLAISAAAITISGSFTFEAALGFFLSGDSWRFAWLPLLVVIVINGSEITCIIADRITGFKEFRYAAFILGVVSIVGSLGFLNLESEKANTLNSQIDRKQSRIVEINNEITRLNTDRDNLGRYDKTKQERISNKVANYQDELSSINSWLDVNENKIASVGAGSGVMSNDFQHGKPGTS